MSYVIIWASPGMARLQQHVALVVQMLGQSLQCSKMSSSIQFHDWAHQLNLWEVGLSPSLSRSWLNFIASFLSNRKAVCDPPQPSVLHPWFYTQLILAATSLTFNTHSLTRTNLGAQKEREGKVVFWILITWFSRSCPSLFQHSGLEQKFPFLLLISAEIYSLFALFSSWGGKKSNLKKSYLKAFQYR